MPESVELGYRVTATNKTGDLSAPACRVRYADRCGHPQAGSEPSNTGVAVL